MYRRLMRTGLQFGSKHKLNAVLKRLLNEVMNPSPNLTVDESFDKELSAAITKFKYLHKIEPISSTADLKTWARIGELLGERRIKEEVKLDREIGKLLSGERIPPQYTPEAERCDKKLAELFGGVGAVASGSGFEPKGHPKNKGGYRGDIIGADGKIRPGHLSSRAMHLYGSSDGTKITGVYVPDGFEKPIKENPQTLPAYKGGSFIFFYSKLKNLEDVTLIVTHLANLTRESTRKNAAGYIYVGDIGGRGATPKDNPDYIHAHFELVQGRVEKGKSTTNMKHYAFQDVFCK